MTTLDAILNDLAEDIAGRVKRSEFVTEDELVSLVGSREKAKRLIKAGAFTGYAVGRRLSADRASFSAYLRRQTLATSAVERSAEDIELAAAERRAGLRVVGER